ncbi:hypothetical protein [Flavobacterium panacagri]|uniref:hypothetical protein n=1 Tax=Flavobacterium panacagri TaxID=3034146 RepID=UPI0025A56CD4|nr:hypothetical protein [Flavobacterium panacagri]
MKKLYILFIILLTLKGFGQTLTGLTYTVEVQYTRNNNNCGGVVVPPTATRCEPGSYTWYLKMSYPYTTIVSEVMQPTATTKTYTVPALATYNLSLSANCYCGSSGSTPCNLIVDQNISEKGINYNGRNYNEYGIENGIKGGNAGGYSIGPNVMICLGTVRLGKFRPNGLSISKVNPSGIPEYIAGQQVDFFAVTPGPATNRFPIAAYHWQYSLDNKVTWIDVPDSYNYTTNPSFTIQNLLGENHVNHFGPIDFRLGYSDRSFTDAYRINYKPGTVILKHRTFENPTCYKDDVTNLVAYFDRQLETGETLAILHLIPYPRPAQVTPMLEQPEVTTLTYDAGTNWYKYAFNIPANTNLENREYVIEYQSAVNGVKKGTLTMGAPFLYQNPEPVKFVIEPLVDPLCNNDLVEVKMKVSGGTGTYKFYVDNNLVTPTPTKEGDDFYHIRNLNPNAENKIKVTDSKDCIEKNI